jgi:methylated-DNA-[protein]-cysteine S-methyltransferase
MRQIQQSPSSKFAIKVRLVVSKIPKGKTMTYGQVAKKAGKPGAARAVGYIMSKNFDPKIPCHRVVRADGKVGDYNRGGAFRKMKLLQEEGALSK